MSDIVLAPLAHAPAPAPVALAALAAYVMHQVLMDFLTDLFTSALNDHKRLTVSHIHLDLQIGYTSVVVIQSWRHKFL